MDESGKPPDNLGAIADALQEDSTVGYKPVLPLESLWANGGDMPQVTLRRDLEFMSMHPVVMSAMEYYKSGIAGAEFWGGPDHNNPDNVKGKPISMDPRVSEFVLAHCERFWQRGMPLLQEGYGYGWAPGEHMYKESSGMMVWSHLKDFHPYDAFILTMKYQPIGIRVKNIRERQPVDLWFASQAIPAKACWYPHRPRFGQLYGRSQYIGAWRPWRRLGWRDAVEQVIDAAVYRAGYKGPVVRHPPEDMQTAMTSVPATKLDGLSHPRRSARDVARQIVEWAKAGAGFTLSSAQYPAAQGGGPKWDIEWPDHVMDVGPLIGAAEYLEEQIMLGIGVPPELVKAGGTGSGYSGRSIPREAFLDQQQKIADAMLQIFIEQVVKPLVLWNFGDVPFEVSVKSLLKSQVENKQGEPKPPLPQPGADAAAGGSPPPGQAAPPQPPEPVSLSLDNRAMEIVRKVIKNGVPLSIDASGHQHKGKGPGGGQFGKGGGGASGGSATPVEGEHSLKKFSTPFESETLKKTVSGASTHELHNGMAAGSGKEDTFLTDVLKESGRAGAPKIVSADDMTKLERDGAWVGFRGVTDPKFAEQFRSGDLYNGAGIFGNGTNVAYKGYAHGKGNNAKDFANGYADAHGAGKGATMVIALPKEAKVVSVSTLRAERLKDQKQLDSDLAAGKITKEQHAKVDQIYADLGRYAALKNYDAISEKSSGILVILNRSICSVQKDNVR